MHKWKKKNYKMVGDKKYTLNKKGVYVDKDGYGSKALGFQIPQKVRKNAQGEWELVPKKHKKRRKNPTAMDNETSVDPKLYGDMLERKE